ncbi:MAG: helix-turn-helix domain-containing protein [Lysobacter sp.]
MEYSILSDRIAGTEPEPHSAEASSAYASIPMADTAIAATNRACALADRGQVVLDSAELRRLRQSRLLSQQDLADDCWRRNIRVSIATIKRAESGRAVRFRIAHELARCFGVPVARIVQTATAPRVDEATVDPCPPMARRDRTDTPMSPN